MTDPLREGKNKIGETDETSVVAEELRPSRDEPPRGRSDSEADRLRHARLWSAPNPETPVLELREGDRQSSESRGLEASRTRRVEADAPFGGEDYRDGGIRPSSVRESITSVKEHLGENAEEKAEWWQETAAFLADAAERLLDIFLASTTAALPPPESGSGLGSASALVERLRRDEANWLPEDREHSWIVSDLREAACVITSFSGALRDGKEREQAEREVIARIASETAAYLASRPEFEVASV